MDDTLPRCAVCDHAIPVGGLIIGLGVGVVERATDGFGDKFRDYEDNTGDSTAATCSRRCLMVLVNTLLPPSSEEKP